MEGGVFGLRHGSNDDVDLKEGVEHVDRRGRDVGLAEGTDLDHLERLLV